MNVSILRPNSCQVVGISGTNAKSSALGNACQIVQLCATVDCHVAFGQDPTATSGSTFLPAKAPTNYLCNPGEKIAVIQDAATGNLFISEGE